MHGNGYQSLVLWVLFKSKLCYEIWDKPFIRVELTFIHIKWKPIGKSSSPFLQVVEGEFKDPEKEHEGQEPTEKDAVEVDEEGEECCWGGLPPQEGRDHRREFRQGPHHTPKPQDVLLQPGDKSVIIAMPLSASLKHL